MKNHTKQIGVKLFDSDVAVLNNIVASLKIKGKSHTTSDAIREALRVYEEFGNVIDKIGNQSKAIEENTKLTKEVYFKLDCIQ